MAWRGQTRAHPPQPWQSSGNTSGWVPNDTIARYWQKRPQAPQPSHRSARTSGTGRCTISSSAGGAFRNRCALGSSTSQSSSWTGVGKTVARFTDTVVLPVPPLPDATAMIMAPPLEPVPRRRGVSMI